jgi:hypothetical protein
MTQIDLHLSRTCQDVTTRLRIIHMSSYLKFLLTAIACLYLTMPVVAQANAGTPEAVVQDYLAAMQAAQWAKCAGLTHTQSLERIRKSSDRFVATLVTFGEGNLHSHFGVASREDYARLSDAVVLERLLSRMAQQPGYREILQATKYKLLGTVKESDDLVHVIYRSDVELFDAQGRRLKVAKFEQSNDVVGVKVEVKVPDEARASVISVKKDGDAWRILAADDVENALRQWQKSLAEFQGHMKKFAEAMLAQRKAKAPRKRKPQRKR